MGSYSAPTIGPAGLSVPSYADILALFTTSFLAIYGQNYNLGNDSAAFQLLSVLALAASDEGSALQLAYNNMSPATSIGVGLSLLVLLNGLQRLVASNSTCTVTLTGTAGAVVNNGVIQNAATGDLWNLPATVTIGGGGTVAVTATAQVAGNINASASQLTVIVTPTAGWTSVTNGSNVPAVGAPTEADSALRIRQALSVQLPSLSLPAGTMAAILAVPGVKRINNSIALGSDGTTSFENFTSATDDWGNPANSISPVVDGGNSLAIATAIYNNRGLGVETNGSTGGTLVSEDVTDPNSGITIAINFARPNVVVIYVIITAHVLPGGTIGTLTPLIQAAVAAYLNGLELGGVVSAGNLYSAAASQTNPEAPGYSIRSPLYFARTSSPSVSTDIQLAFYEAASGVTADIAVNWV